MTLFILAGLVTLAVAILYSLRTGPVGDNASGFERVVRFGIGGVLFAVAYSFAVKAIQAGQGDPGADFQHYHWFVMFMMSIALGGYAGGIVAERRARAVS